eukprot:TRINITY_DN22317_c0_g1_i2.p1 TRINITY_DN22317_c0_g1~~TRINITY_DN22317_c0_g1_i2.p1  ORF type:complete len:990 (+),score=193.67 TRINITY_DN22317_c0_g1_i2:29-2971(+)
MASLPSADARDRFAGNDDVAGASAELAATGPLRRISVSLEQSLRRVPCLLDAAAAPADVLPLSTSLHRLIEEDCQPALSRIRSAPGDLHLLTLQRRTSRGRSPAEHGPRTASRIAWLVFLFVALDATKSLGVAWAAVNGHICGPLVICAKSACSIACGMILASLLDGVAGVKQCLHFRRAVKVLPVACCFCAAQTCSLQALRAYDAGSLKILAQVNMPATALLSRVFLGRKYTVLQWLATTLLLFATMAFMHVRMLFFEPPRLQDGESVPVRSPDKVVGMLYFLTSIALSCSASVLAEKFLKQRYEIPFYIQKTNLMLGELVSAVFLIQLEKRGSCSWEQVTDWRQLPVIIIWFVHGWIAGLLVKRCSALVKNVSHILSALVTYFLPLLLITGSLHFWPVTLSAVLVLIALLVFGTVPREEQLLRQQRRDSRETMRQKALFAERRSRSSAALFAQGFNVQNRKEAALSRGTPNIFRVPLSTECLNNSVPGGDDDRPINPASSSGSSMIADRWRLEETALESGFTRQKSPDAGTPGFLDSLCFLVFCFVLLDAAKPILLNWAQEQRTAQDEGIIHGTFVLVQTMLSLAVGLLIAAAPTIERSAIAGVPALHLHPRWRHRLRDCVDMRAVMSQLPVSGCLCLSKLFLVMALQRLDAGTVRIFGQASLPLVGVSAAVVLRKRYSMLQWSSLVAISVALVTFYYVKAEVKLHAGLVGSLVGGGGASTASTGSGVEVAGVLLIIASIASNCLGSLFVEKFLQGEGGRLHAQKAQLLLGEIIVNAALVFLLPPLLPDPDLRRRLSPWRRGLFVGWDRRVLVCVALWIPAGWTATMLVKRCSNLLKTIAQATSAVLTYVFSVVPLHSGPRAWTRVVEFFGPPLTPEPFSWPVVLLAGTVLLAALLFGMDSWSQELARRYDRRDGDGALGKMTKSYVNGNVFPASTDAVAPSGADGHTIDLAHYSSLLRRNRHAASASTGNLAAMWRG